MVHSATVAEVARESGTFDDNPCASWTSLGSQFRRAEAEESEVAADQFGGSSSRRHLDGFHLQIANLALQVLVPSIRQIAIGTRQVRRATISDDAEL